MKPFKKLTLALAALVLAGSTNAQLLWKVESPNGKTSYLFGTHHIAPISVLDSVPGFADALAQAETVYGEVVASEMQSPATMSKMQQFMMAPADSTLSSLLSPAQLDSLTTVLQKYAGQMMTANQLEPLTPAAISMQLALLQAMKSFPNFNPAQQLDTEVQTRALALGKEVGGLETVELQLEKLLGMPLIRQAEDLMHAIRNDEVASEAAIDMANAYLSGNLRQMFELMTDPRFGFDDEDAERLLYSRNDSWVSFLVGALPTASMLIVVGAGHLPGERGLIRQLENKGFTVTAVK